MTTKILVTGSRKATNYKFVADRLRYLIKEYDWKDPFIIHGNYSGVDTLASKYAVEINRPSAAVNAYWFTNGPKAGPMRNGWMLELTPDVCVAFPGGSGTADMKRQARDAGIPIFEVLK